MTSPIETNNVVERLVVARDTLAGHLMHNEANYVTLGIQVIQSLSDRIDVLEGEVARLRNIANEDSLNDPELAALAGKPMNALEASVAKPRKFDSSASLTQGGNTNV